LVRDVTEVVRIVDLKFCKIIVTREDVIFSDNGVLYFLSDETGWWENDGTIYVWGYADSQLEIVVHEVVEFVLMRKLRLPRWVGHNVAVVVEKVVGLVWRGVKYLVRVMRGIKGFVKIKT